MNRIAPILAAALMVAGCATGGGLGIAASHLDSSAHRFYEEVYYGRGTGHAADDAAMLAEAATDFSQAVDRGRSREELQPSFDRVADRYHHLRRQVESRDTRYSDSALAFERVTDAYLDVDRAMNHPDSRYHE